MENLEILAPVGNKESLKSAINSGADAVYLGLSNFNARANAENFDEKSLRDIVKYAHLYGVKIYVTINTLINDNEVAPFLELVKYAVQSKVDAFIVQDLGVASILKNAFPNIVLHASTQMGIHNLPGALMAQQLGFKRIILSRETKLEDIKLIKKYTNLEIEYFVMGALCVAFSGNCYFSSMCNSKSGNRGKCLQLCRLPYSYDKQKFNYYLSPSDLCLIQNLKELIDAGVSSFKIEGRLRRPSYVVQTVQSFKKALDNIKYNYNINYEKEIYKLKKVFNRGDYNQRAYLDNNTPNKIVNINCNNHIGVPIGRVLNVQKFKNIYKITINSTHNIKQNDGLKFFEKNKEIASIGVGNCEKIDKNNYVVYSKHCPTVNSSVNLILDSEYEAYLLKINRKLNVDFKVIAKLNRPLSIIASYNDLEVQVFSQYICPEAQKSPTTEEEIISQISKLNDTYFVVQNMHIDNDNVFIPKSVLNSLRRQAIEDLSEKIIQFNEKNITTSIDNSYSLPNTDVSFLPMNIVILNDFYDLERVDKNSIIAYAPKVWNVEKTVQDLIYLSENGFKTALYLPIVANSYDIKLIDDILDKLSFKPILVSNNIWSLHYIQKGYSVIAGYNHNVFNSFTSKKLKEIGTIAVVQSIENESTKQSALIGYRGRPALMTFCHCPYKTKENSTCAQCPYTKDLSLYNQQNKAFKIRRIRLSLCYFELLSNAIYKSDNKYYCLDLRDLDKNEFTQLI